MLPGKDQYYQCPQCENILSKCTLISGNIFDAIQYSDGKTIAMMLPQFPQISKCYDCNCIFWLNEANLIDKPAGKSSCESKFLSFNEYFEALDKSIFSTKEEEKYIRQHIWWKFNDRARNGNKLFLRDDDEQRWKQNLNKLENLLDFADAFDKLLIIEINRNLGNFDKCKYLLSEIDDPNVNWIKEKLEIEVEKENRKVILL